VCLASKRRWLIEVGYNRYSRIGKSDIVDVGGGGEVVEVWWLDGLL